MHVLLVSETYPPEINGVALTVECLLQNLLHAGHRVTLVRPRQGDEVAAPALPRSAEILTRGLPIPRYPGLRFGLPAGARIRRLIREQGVDAVYVATEGPLGWSAVSAANALNVPVACGFHTRFDDYVRHYGVAFLESAALAWMRRFHNRASCTLVPTQELEHWLRARGFARVERLRRAVDNQRFHPHQRDADLRRCLGVSHAAPLVLFVGRLAPEKNLDLAVAAFERIAALSPGARMLWIGDGPSRAELQRQNPRHLFAGVLRGEALACHFASADLFLFPSVTETFGNVTLEAMASGLTVCAFDYAAAHEHIENGVSGELAAFAHAGEFVRLAEKATRDWLRGRRLGVAARQAIEHLSPPRVADDFVQLMNGYIARSSTPVKLEKRRDATVFSTLL
jgi:glycosyltransferase involved in cell wall biosynthesis